MYLLNLIYVNGSHIPVEKEADIKEVIVFDRTDAPSTFQIKVADNDYNFCNDDNYFVDSHVKISLGYKEAMEELIDGIITGLDLNFRKNEALSAAIARCLK